MDIITEPTTPATMLRAARLRVTALASCGDKSVLGGGAGVFADAAVNQGLYAWSPPS